MADLNEKFDGSQTTRHEADERAGLGLLSRFLGAVFLVLLGGLLLLDRALLRANQNQAELDAQSAGLLTESFVAGQAALLDRIAGIISGREAKKDSVTSRQMVERLITAAPGLRRVWMLDSAGRLKLDVGDGAATRELNPELLSQLHAIRPAGQFSISVIPIASRHALVALVHAPDTTGIRDGRIAGLAFDGDALKAWLERTQPGARRTLVVLSGMDTVAFLGKPGGNAQALSAGQKIIRLPNGGTWGVTATHALTTRSLRWAIWTLGVLGVLLLALGLLREQRRALQAAGRSTELERLYSDVKRANQAKSEFLANVSHELRTPLNAIVGFVELLRDGFYGDLSPRQVPPVDRIAASATHLRHLVDQVLDIAKIAAGRLEIHAETIVLRPFVLNVASELESLVSEKDLTFSITVGASLPRVRTDPTHLRQILINLIGNAVKYTPTGTVSVRARLVGVPSSSTFRRTAGTAADDAGAKVLLLRAPRSGTWIALQVVDTGVGIAAADLERIFDEFEQVNAGPRGDSMNRGTGLGLAISRRLARLLGGEIGVESELGRGSTFTVWLPVNAADLTRDATEQPVLSDISSA
ncbi:MAG: HAMP domain-containing sensor histidine kinase [bacterium]